MRRRVQRQRHRDVIRKQCEMKAPGQGNRSGLWSYSASRYGGHAVPPFARVWITWLLYSNSTVPTLLVSHTRSGVPKGGKLKPPSSVVPTTRQVTGTDMGLSFSTRNRVPHT